MAINQHNQYTTAGKKHPLKQAILPLYKVKPSFLNREATGRKREYREYSGKRQYHFRKGN